jgi:hypothetical protein
MSMRRFVIRTNFAAFVRTRMLELPEPNNP